MDAFLKDISFPNCNSKFSDYKNLSFFFGSAICLNLSYVHHTDIIDLSKLKKAIRESNQNISRGDIVLIYTGHSDRFHNTAYWNTRRTLMTYSAVKHLESLGVKNLGLDAPSIIGDTGFECFSMVLTFSLSNIGHLVNSRFIYAGFPAIKVNEREYLVRASAFL